MFKSYIITIKVLKYYYYILQLLDPPELVLISPNDPTQTREYLTQHQPATSGSSNEIMWFLEL